MQVVIIPIVFGNRDTNEAVLDACALVRDTLTGGGVRVKIDCGDERPGAKYYRWEQKGVPVRIEIGPRDLEKNSVMLVRRDTSEKRSVAIDRIAHEVADCMNAMHGDMLRSALQEFDSRIFDCTTLDEVKETAAHGIARIPWCLGYDCGREMEEVTGIRMLGVPIESQLHAQEGSAAPTTTGHCPICGREGTATLMARTY